MLRRGIFIIVTLVLVFSYSGCGRGAQELGQQRAITENPFDYQGEYSIDQTKLNDDERIALPYVQKQSEAQRVSPALLMAIVKQESAFRRDVVGDSGVAIGYMQLHWDAAYDAGYRSKRDTFKAYSEESKKLAREDWPTDGLVPETNVKYGCGYLRICYDKHKGSVVYNTLLKNAISAYNLGWPHGPDKGNEASYVNPIVKYYEDYKSKTQRLEQKPTTPAPTPAAAPTAEPATTSKIWHVDDDLRDYPKADFTKIGQALNAVSAGGTIIVYPGTYTENLDVAKGQLTIKSQNGADSTTIQALNSNDHVFEIKAAGVKISGFTIRGATGNDKAGVYSYDIPLSVSDLILSNNNYGIYVYSTPKSPIRVSGSTFSGNNRGIYSQSSLDSRYGEVHVSDSTFSNNKYGIYTSNFCGVDVSKSAFSNNDYGIYGHDRMSISAEYSSFSNNTYGIYGDSTWGINSLYSKFDNNEYGVYAVNGWDNTLSISYSDLRSNRWGIYYKASTQSSHSIFLNNFIGNTSDVDSSPSKYIWNSTERMTYTHNGKTYDSYLGNYWSGYSGRDINDDGIGDTPYGLNGIKDNYPLMGIWKDGAIQ